MKMVLSSPLSNADSPKTWFTNYMLTNAPNFRIKLLKKSVLRNLSQNKQPEKRLVAIFFPILGAMLCQFLAILG
jgi:hypothetical protein